MCGIIVKTAYAEVLLNSICSILSRTAYAETPLKQHDVCTKKQNIGHLRDRANVFC